MSAAILNAIFDIENAFLYSCDLEIRNYKNPEYEVGSIVKNNFPEFLNKWKLFIGNTTSAFIEEIGNNIDFVFIDTAHVLPGEVLNMIEIFPFLKKNAIIAFDDIEMQAKKRLFNQTNFYPCNNLLFSVLRGKKIIMLQIYLILENLELLFYQIIKRDTFSSIFIFYLIIGLICQKDLRLML